MRILKIAALLIIVASPLLTAGAQDLKSGKSSLTKKPYQFGYAPVNGLKMYYEIHGTGKPIILVHGAFSGIGTSFGKVLAELASTRKVIAIEYQGHARTGDIDRPLSYEQLGDDLATFMKFAKIPKADVWGYSLGAAVCIQLYLQHPELVDKMVLTSVGYSKNGFYKELWDAMQYIKPEVFEGSIYKREYDSLAPDAKAFPELVKKKLALDSKPMEVPEESIRAIKAPTLIILGDADIVKPEHAVQMLRLLGGGVIGDMAGLPNSRLAILPGTSHTTVMTSAEVLIPMVNSFLDAPVKK